MAAAQEAIHGLELVGRRISVALVADAPPNSMAGASMPAALPNMLPNIMGMGCMAPMGMAPPGVAMAPNMGMIGASGVMPHSALPPGMPGVAAPSGLALSRGAPSCLVLLKNMFDPHGRDERDDPDFFDDLCEDVSEEVYQSVERST